MAKAPATTKPKPGQSVALPESQLPAHLMDQIEDDAGRGVSTSAADIGIPFLYILQDLSPQVKKRNEKYIEGAEVGMIFNNQTQEIIVADDGIDFIPCFFKSALVEWTPRDAGGGWVAEHPMDSDVLRRSERPDPKKPPRIKSGSGIGNDVVETKYYYGWWRLHVDGDENPNQWSEAVIGMASSMLSCSRTWQGMLRRVKTPGGVQAPSWSKVFHLTSKLVAKNNNEWFVWDVAELRWVTAEEYAAGRKLADSCEEGLVQASRPDQTGLGGGAEGALSEVDEQVL